MLHWTLWTYNYESERTALNKHDQVQIREWKARENEGNSPRTQVFGIKSRGRVEEVVAYFRRLH
jgi:hypothetical protein